MKPDLFSALTVIALCGAAAAHQFEKYGLVFIPRGRRPPQDNKQPARMLTGETFDGADYGEVHGMKMTETP